MNGVEKIRPLIKREGKRTKVRVIDKHLPRAAVCMEMRGKESLYP